jgi:hypothetical protein
MKNFLMPLLALFLLFSSCSKVEERIGLDSRAPKFSKEYIRFDEAGGNQIISADIDFTFIFKREIVTSFGYIGIVDDEDFNIYIKRGFIYKIENKWLSVVRTDKEPKILQISVRPILDDLKYRKKSLMFLGQELPTIISIEQTNSMEPSLEI